MLKVLFQRPSCRYGPVAFGSDVIYLKHQFNADRRAPFGWGPGNCPPGGPETHGTPPQRNVRDRIAAVRGVTGQV